MGRPNLNAPTIERLEIPLPPFAEQKRIVSEAERQVSGIDQFAEAVEANLRRSDRLRHMILRSAFEGRLVPQDPSDEPTSVLLERIRKETAATAEAAAMSERERRSRRGRRGTMGVARARGATR